MRKNLVLVNRDKGKVLDVGQTILTGRYRLRTSWLGSSPAEKGLGILVDKRSSSWDFNTCRAALSIYPAGASSVYSPGEATLDTHCPVWEQPVHQRLLRWEGLEHMMCEEVGLATAGSNYNVRLTREFTGKMAQGFSLRWSPTG